MIAGLELQSWCAVMNDQWNDLAQSDKEVLCLQVTLIVAWCDGNGLLFGNVIIATLPIHLSHGFANINV